MEGIYAGHQNLRQAIGLDPAKCGRHRGLHSQGFTTFINNRPDGEDTAQLGTKVEAQAAGQYGLAYSHIPVTMSTITEADVRAFQDAMRQSDGPVFAHCKGGTRSLSLYVIGEVLDGRMKAADVAAFGRAHGFDMGVAETWLARQTSRRPQVRGFFDARTSSIQYVVSDPDAGKCAIIDPVLDFDEKSGATATINADAILDYVRAQVSRSNGFSTRIRMPIISLPRTI